MRGELAAAVVAFAHAAATLDDAALTQEWRGSPGSGNWESYTDDRREVIFVVYQELRQLASDIKTERVRRGPGMTAAQRILAQHQAAYRDFGALLVGLKAHEVDQPPAANEWSVREVVVHVLNTEYWGFFPQIEHALALQAQDRPAAVLGEEEVLAYYGPRPTTEGEWSELLARYETLHSTILDRLSSLNDEQLVAPSIWWEEYPVPVRFRMHRFDSHLREHTIQIEKTLAGINHSVRESERLVRPIYAALAEVEGALIGAEQTLSAEQAALAAQIKGWTAALQG